MRKEEREHIQTFLNDVQSLYAEDVVRYWEEQNYEAFWNALGTLVALSEAENTIAKGRRPT